MFCSALEQSGREGKVFPKRGDSDLIEIETAVEVFVEKSDATHNLEKCHHNRLSLYLSLSLLPTA